MENNIETLDFTGKKLKKLNKPSPTESHVSVLILDENELQRLDNIDSFTKVQKLSVVRNQLLRMYGVCRLHNLHTLNLAHNGILTIEGLKELVNLKYLCLTGNNIKTIEHLNNNVNLEHLDLSENNITYVSDLSFLKNLKELLLHGNRISHLRQCDKYLPTSLTTLTLASNNISDLNEISQLVQLLNLVNFSISNNPCVNMTNGNVGFDYRPFIINWCMNVKVIDGYVVDAIESLRAEWLYSQGKGRHYRIGDHQELAQYLATVCPLSGEALETEEDRKLRLILSKAQHHQQQLREQLTTNGVMDTSTPSPIQRRRIANNKNSPRLGSKFIQSTNSPDRMTASCYSTTGSFDSNSIMTQSLDPNMLSQTIAPTKTQHNAFNETEKEANNHKKEKEIIQMKEKETNGVLPGYCLKEVIDIHSPLKAATKLVPVPESLMSPDYRPSNSLVHRLAPQTQSTLVQNNNRNIIKPKEALTGSPKLTRNSQTSKIQTFDNRKTPSPLRTRKNIPQPTAIKNNEIISNSGQQKNVINNEDEADICVDKLQTIKNIAQERSLKKNTESESSSSERAEHDAAIFIQKMWRGFHTRNKNKKAVDILKAIQQHRTEEYIQKLSSDMESTKAALESERKIQMLQMQAINALWKKVSTIQAAPKEDNTSTSIATGDNTEAVKSLAHTCTMLNAQVQQLQNSMQDIMRCMTTFIQVPHENRKKFEDGIATQTEIIAVHTPQGEAGKVFPYLKTPNQRPSSLPLPVSQRSKQQPTTTGSGSQTEAPSEVKQFAGSLVEGVIKTVSETSSECGGDNQDDDTITDDIIETYDDCNQNANTSENNPSVQSTCT